MRRASAPPEFQWRPCCTSIRNLSGYFILDNNSCKSLCYALLKVYGYLEMRKAFTVIAATGFGTAIICASIAVYASEPAYLEAAAGAAGLTSFIILAGPAFKTIRGIFRALVGQIMGLRRMLRAKIKRRQETRLLKKNLQEQNNLRIASLQEERKQLRDNGSSNNLDIVNSNNRQLHGTETQRYTPPNAPPPPTFPARRNFVIGCSGIIIVWSILSIVVSMMEEPKLNSTRKGNESEGINEVKLLDSRPNGLYITENEFRADFLGETRSRVEQILGVSRNGTPALLIYTIPFNRTFVTNSSGDTYSSVDIRFSSSGSAEKITFH